MQRPLARKIAKGTGIVLVLLAALLLTGTWIINLDPIQMKIRTAVERRTGDFK